MADQQHDEELAAFADALTDGIVEAGRGTLDEHAVAYWWDCPTCPGPVVTVGSAHDAGPIYRLTMTRLTGRDEEVARQMLGLTYDENWASYYDETLVEFRAHLADGHLYDGYVPHPASPAWPHRERHAAFRAEMEAETKEVERAMERAWTEGRVP